MQAKPETTPCPMCDQAGACTDLCRGTDAGHPAAWVEAITRDDSACLVDEARRVTIAEMREAVEGISSARAHAEHQAGVRWAQARMLHALAEMEAAVP